jgi:short-subunit dehydrogenase
MRSLAFVTGASSGIGEAFARRLAADGQDLVLVARRRDRLERLAEELAKDHGVESDPCPADLATNAGCEAVIARMDSGPPPALLVNAAGFAGYGPFLEAAPEDIEALVAVHVRAVARLSHAAGRAMAVARRGAIVNVASRLALSGTLPPLPLPYRALYAGAKSFQLAFSEALAGELGAVGVRVQALLPGVVRTDFHGPGGPAAPPAYVMEPEEVAAESLAALERGELVCAPGLADPSLIPLLGKLERAIVMSAPATPQPASSAHADG